MTDDAGDSVEPLTGHEPCRQTSHRFKANVKTALADAQPPGSRSTAATDLHDNRAASACWRHFRSLRCDARGGAKGSRTTRSTHLDHYLEEFERKALASGAIGPLGAHARTKRPTSSSAFCQARSGAKSVTQGSSRCMVRRSASTRPWPTPASSRVETDLGEHIIQLAPRSAEPHHRHAGDPHDNADQVEADSVRAACITHPRRRGQRTALLVARRGACCGNKYFAADVGITGANFLVAETGSIVLSDQRGQRRTHPDPAASTHIVIASASRRLRADAGRRLRRSSFACWRAPRTGQDISAYTTFLHRPETRAGPGRAGGIPHRPPGQPAAPPMLGTGFLRTCCAASAAAPA